MGCTYIPTHENSLVHGFFIGTLFYSMHFIPMKKISTETFMDISQDHGNFMVIA